MHRSERKAAGHVQVSDDDSSAGSAMLLQHVLVLELQEMHKAVSLVKAGPDVAAVITAEETATVAR